MQEGTNKTMDFGCCQSMMEKCFSQGTKEGKGAFDFKDCGHMMKKFCSTEGGNIDVKNCEQMMKNFCGTKDGKIDFESCRSKMDDFCKSMKTEPDDKVTK
jgi:Ca2+-binding EF-hand superfamily protein